MRPSHPVELLIGVPDAKLRERWQAAFAGVPEVEICTDVLAMRSRPDVQCLWLDSLPATEEWGADLFLADEAQLCSTAQYYGWGEKPEMPPYVVTIVVVEWSPAEHTIAESAAHLLTLVLRCLDRANREGIQPSIRRLALAKHNVSRHGF